MAPLNEGTHTAEFLLTEGNGQISREQCILAAGAPALKAGTLVGITTATGKLGAYLNSDTTTGLGVAVGVLYDNAPDLAVDQKVTYIARLAEVHEAALTGLDVTGRADLAAINIIVRK